MELDPVIQEGIDRFHNTLAQEAQEVGQFLVNELTTLEPVQEVVFNVVFILVMCAFPFVVVRLIKKLWYELKMLIP